MQPAEPNQLTEQPKAAPLIFPWECFKPLDIQR